MRFLSCERVSEHKYKTPEGYLVCVDSILARTGKQTYRRDEVFHDGNDSEIEVDRKPEEVFSAQTLASFENKPLTVEHPDVDITADNHKDYAVGYVRDVKKGEVDGKPVMLGTLVITDAQTIEEIENGEHTDLSCGYNCDIDDEENPQQRNIRGNHVALCQSGRAGIARIVDSKEYDMTKRNIDDKQKLPANIKKELQRIFRAKSTYLRNRDYDIADFVQEIERWFRIDGTPIKFIREKIDGWKKMGDGMMRKDYTFSIDGYDDRFIVSLYAKPDTYETTELNAHMLDADVEDDCTNDDFYSAFTTMADVFADKLRGYVSQGKSVDKAFAEMKFTKQGNQYVKHSGEYDIVFAVDGKKVTYYVLEKGRIPSGYTRTIMTLDSCTKDIDMGKYELDLPEGTLVYGVVDNNGADIEEKLFVSKDAAMRYGEYMWNHLIEHEKKRYHNGNAVFAVVKGRLNEDGFLDNYDYIKKFNDSCTKDEKMRKIIKIIKTRM